MNGNSVGKKQTELAADYREFLDSRFLDAVYALAEKRRGEIMERLHLHATHGKLGESDNLLGVELKHMEDILSGDFFDRAYRRANAEIQTTANARASAAKLFDKAVTPGGGDFSQT